VDDIYNVDDILDAKLKEKYCKITKSETILEEDTLQIGYLKIDEIA
jgi:hypothetical protein